MFLYYRNKNKLTKKYKIIVKNEIRKNLIRTRNDLNKDKQVWWIEEKLKRTSNNNNKSVVNPLKFQLISFINIYLNMRIDKYIKPGKTDKTLLKL